MSTATLDPVITGHRHWAGFDEEAAKTQKLLDKAQKHTAKTDDARRSHAAAMAAYEAEQISAVEEDRDPDPRIKDPGDFKEPRPLFGRRSAIEVVHERVGQVEEMRRSWAKRMAPELVPDLDDRDRTLLSNAQALVAQAAETMRELGVARESREWLASVGANQTTDVTAAPSLFEVRNLMTALADALRRAALPSTSDGTAALTDGEGWSSVGMNLDNVSIEV